MGHAIRRGAERGHGIQTHGRAPRGRGKALIRNGKRGEAVLRHRCAVHHSGKAAKGKHPHGGGRALMHGATERQSPLRVATESGRNGRTGTATAKICPEAGGTAEEMTSKATLRQCVERPCIATAVIGQAEEPGGAAAKGGGMGTMRCARQRQGRHRTAADTNGGGRLGGAVEMTASETKRNGME